MIDKILGTVFLLASGSFYLTERWLDFYVMARIGGGRRPHFYEDIIVYVFGILGAVILSRGYLRKRD